MPSATDAAKALCATERKDNFQRLCRLLMCGGVRLLREKFDSIHSPSNLPLILDDPATRDSLKNLFKEQRDCLYPSPGTFGKSADFDITLMFRLFRTICDLSKDTSLEADLVRIKNYRNSVAHNSKREFMDSEFRNLWNEISEVLLRIAGSMGDAKRDEWEKAIDRLLTAPLTTEAQRYVDELQLWYKNDMEVKDAVEQVGLQLQQVNADVRQLQQGSTDQHRQINQRLGKLKTYWIRYRTEYDVSLFNIFYLLELLRNIILIQRAPKNNLA